MYYKVVRLAVLFGMKSLPAKEVMKYTMNVFFFRDTHNDSQLGQPSMQRPGGSEAADYHSIKKRFLYKFVGEPEEFLLLFSLFYHCARDDFCKINSILNWFSSDDHLVCLSAYLSISSSSSSICATSSHLRKRRITILIREPQFHNELQLTCLYKKMQKKCFPSCCLF